MDEDNEIAAPGQVRPGRGRGQNQKRNRGRANGDPNWRNRGEGGGHGVPNQQQRALMPLMQIEIPLGQGFQRRGQGGPRQNLGPRNVRNNTADANIVRGNDQQNNRNDDTKRHNQRPRTIGFRALDEMANADKEDVIPQLSQKKVLFFELIDRINSENNADLFVLIMQILSKVCQSSFDELKLQFLLEICNSEFIAKLRNYLMDLPYATVKAKNHLYWNNPQGFWTNFIIFCESIINVSPSTALNKCRSLIDGTSKCCLEGLTERHNFVLQEQDNVKLAHLRERLTESEKEEKIQVRSTVYQMNIQEDDENFEPPEDFRQLSVLPRRDDLLERHPYVRSNIVNGSYRDTEHYLDIQFRLLREDCFGPLRDGVAQFIEDPNRKKYDNIRVFRNVKFIMPYVSNNKVGSLIQLDDNTVKRQKRINWAHSKRFIFGSLLLFTKDNCRSFITATILDREPKALIQGQIPVSVIDGAATNNLYNNESYAMIESEVYFEPYYHVLKALQDPRFPENLAMRKYIINVDPEPNPPAYLTPVSEYRVETTNLLRTKFKVLDNQTWPSEEDLGLNASQYEAYKLALTHEFAVIQGPPGTGKTFLGVKVASTLLENRPYDGPMLVICYTNHALDQFLEAILPITKSMARIGGQSRNEAMEARNLSTLRKVSGRTKDATNSLFYEQKRYLKRSVTELQQAQERIDKLRKEVICYDSVKEFVPESRVLGRYYASNRANVVSDPMEHWLFELMELGNFEVEETEEENFQAINLDDDDDNNRRRRFGVDLDDLGINRDEEIIYFDQQINISFSAKDTEERLKLLVQLYKHATHPMQQEQLQHEIVYMKSRLFLYNTMFANRRETTLQINDRMDLSRIALRERWSLYFRWANIVTNFIRTRIRPLQESLESANTAYEEARMMMDLRILRGIKVIGMTTSGAARLRKLLQALAPPVVIVEEAAEVLEQHIVTSLTRDCQHLILIGDHQQLRPSAAHMKLARYYNIEVSLFERMINNGMHSRRLGVQHRMRPEIAALISPHIYEHLDNHHSVELFPGVRGITDNLFFFTHDQMEERVDDSSSRSNAFEGDMTLGLANYLMQQGYQPEDITILAAYSGQMFYLRKQRANFTHLAKIKITVVDNYQGEESKIILLSLVRNNTENKIGFLGTENRVCVALSRAREGFYIFGNIDILKSNSELWKKIADTLQNKSAIGNAIMLRCENHNQITPVSTQEDFNKVPEGGCLLKCEFNLPCGHKCPLVCHGYDRNHDNIKCYFPCEREICDLQHPCPLLCWNECQPCKIKVVKKLPCGHSMSVACYKDPTDERIRCSTIVTVTLPPCKHEVNLPCHEKVETAKCPVKCEVRVEKCGHECLRTCHVKEDPDHERYLCEKPCARAKNGCTADLDGDRGDHQCPKKCHEACDDCNIKVNKKRSNCKHSGLVACKDDINETPCKKNCARMLDCGHFCKKKCFEQCGDCAQRVTKEIPDCKHKIATICMKPATRDLCRRKCERIMSCGHRCADRCDKPCDTKKCNELVPIKYKSPCGHNVMLPCKVHSLISAGATMEASTLLKYCKERCNQTLDCEHVCAGTCSECHQGRLHAACAETCHQMNICGHQCKEPCNQACPPCSVPCEIKCPHSRCNRLCGAPCVPCQEKCTRKCKHGACTKRCGEPCNWPPCNERCDKTLKCSHPCRGLCGEPCPDICKICKPDDHRLFDFLGDEIDDDAMFVQFQDCPHALDVENMDNLMTGDMDTINVRSCPFCRKPIINTFRYKDIVYNMFKKEINPIKEKVHGRPAEINREKQKLLKNMAEFCKDHGSLLQANQHLLLAFEQLQSAVKTQKKVSLQKLKMQTLYLNILDMITQCYQKYNAAKLTELSDEFHTQIKILCRVLRANTHKISPQLQIDIGNELKRMNSIIQLSQILSHDSYKSITTVSEVVTNLKLAKDNVLSWRVFREDEAVNALEKLQKAVNIHGIVSKQERDMIVEIIASKAGSWYKCPNGHPYCIADCGGAMVVSKCADCGAAIGGTNHTLLASNSHAGEMDGSRHAAWSNAYDNMANFQL